MKSAVSTKKSPAGSLFINSAESLTFELLKKKSYAEESSPHLCYRVFSDCVVGPGHLAGARRHLCNSRGRQHARFPSGRKSSPDLGGLDRKSTRLNSSHVRIS